MWLSDKTGHGWQDIKGLESERREEAHVSNFQLRWEALEYVRPCPFQVQPLLYLSAWPYRRGWARGQMAGQPRQTPHASQTWGTHSSFPRPPGTAEACHPHGLCSPRGSEREGGSAAAAVARTTPLHNHRGTVYWGNKENGTPGKPAGRQPCPIISCGFNLCSPACLTFSSP